MNDIETLHKWIDTCPPNGMVFFGGAGVSTESGIPDFRSQSGLYNQKTNFSYPPEIMLSRSFFDAHPAEFFEFFEDIIVPHNIKPNAAHKKLAELEEQGICGAVITQNIDGLHQEAGSTNVLELHGSVNRAHCMKCGTAYTHADLQRGREKSTNGIPRCKKCGGIIKPDVVLYEEALDESVVSAAIDAIAQANLFIVAGTSLQVYPAAGMIDYFSGEHLVVINQDHTTADTKADLCIHDKVGKVLGKA